MSSETQNDYLSTTCAKNEVDVSVAENPTNYISRCRIRYQAVEELLEYATEHGKLEQPELAKEVKKLKKVFFYTSPENLSLDELCEAEAELEKIYAKVSETVSPVSILTLRTTSTDYEISRPWWQAIFLGSGSVGRNFFRKLFWIAASLVAIMFTLHVSLEADNKILTIFGPFLYGALGAVIYVYKNLTDRYIERTLHPYELSTDWLRIFMGAVTGGLIVHMFSGYLPDPNTDLNITPMTFGFLAGYSVEFFYQLLDKLIHTITAATHPQESKTAPVTPRQAQIELLTKSLKDMTDEADKAVIRGLLEKI
jgi:hypothetical protein